MTTIFVFLLILFAALSMGTTMMLPQSNTPQTDIIEGLKTMEAAKGGSQGSGKACGCKTDADCTKPGSYCMNYPPHQEPHVCHGDSEPLPCKSDLAQPSPSKPMLPGVPAPPPPPPLPPAPSPPAQPSTKPNILPGVPDPCPAGCRPHSSQSGAVCTAPDGLDGDCKTVYAHNINKQGEVIIKECRGKPGFGMYETDCPYAYLVDNSSPAKVCDMTKANLDYVRTNKKMPSCAAPSGGALGPGGTQNLVGGCRGTRYGCCPDGKTAKKSANDSCYPRPHGKHGHGRRVPDNMEHSKYKKFLPSNLDELSISREKYEEIGRDFIKDEAASKGITTPYIHDSEAEVLGRLVWRVYVAEMEQKRANSPKAEDMVMERELRLLKEVTKIMKSDTDQHRGKKCQPAACSASPVGSCNPLAYSHNRTTNQFGYRPENNHNLHREPGHAFEGRPIHGSPRYYDITNATEHCFSDRACGGVNFDSTTGEYTLMPVHARIVKRPHYTALLKERHSRPTRPGKSSDGQHHTHHKHHKHDYGPGTTESPYIPITGIGYSKLHPRNPNDMPRPYNSIMDLFR